MRISGPNVKKVILLTKTVTYGDHNEEVVTWAADTSKFPEGKFYVEWWDQGGRETLANGQLTAIKDIRCKCRYITDLNESEYMIRKDSKDYDIESIQEIGRQEGQILILKLPDNA